MLVTKLRHCLIGVALLAPLLARASCWEEAGASYGIEPALLKAIAWKESRGHPNAIGPVDPKTGHRAYGLMQIYSVHLPLLAKYGITKEQLFDACTSQKVGAWVHQRVRHGHAAGGAGAVPQGRGGRGDREPHAAVQGPDVDLHRAREERQ